MVSKKVLIANKLGLHARAASALVKLASSYKSKVILQKDGFRANGKSILSVMAIGAQQGAELELVIDGPDARKAMINLESLINNKFGEAE